MTSDQIRASQRTLPLTVAQTVALLDVNGARTVLGVDAESVAAMVDDGRLLWVWDFALSPSASARRELRFWKLDLLAAAAAARDEAAPIGTRDLLLPTVIDTLLPVTKGAFNSWELQSLFTVSGQQIQRLCAGRHLVGEVRKHTLLITRSSLVAFLTKRLASN